MSQNITYLCLLLFYPSIRFIVYPTLGKLWSGFCYSVCNNGCYAFRKENENSHDYLIRVNQENEKTLKRFEEYTMKNAVVGQHVYNMNEWVEVVKRDDDGKLYGQTYDGRMFSMNGSHSRSFMRN